MTLHEEENRCLKGEWAADDDAPRRQVDPRGERRGRHEHAQHAALERALDDVALVERQP